MATIKDERVYLLQVGLKDLGFYNGKLDGNEGPMTKAAFDAWQDSLVPAAPAVEVTGKIGDAIIAIAQKEVGIRETTKNQGPGLAKYWTATSYPSGYKNREPYCAAFICWVISQAARGKNYAFSLPKSPVAYDFESWAKANAKNGVKFVRVSEAKAGDIFTLSVASHVGLVKSRSGDTLYTIEGNTDGAGTREGDGVYEKARKASIIRKVIRISE